MSYLEGILLAHLQLPQEVRSVKLEDFLYISEYDIPFASQ